MAKKYLDQDGLLYVVQKIKTWLSGKVDKVEGKGLSTNDYTTAEKTKLAGIETGATKVTIDASLSSTSSNPVENKAINSALGNKVDKVSGKGLSTNDYTTAEKEKLAGIAAGANNYSLPTASSSVLGGVKVGTNLSISDGVLSAKDTTYNEATTSTAGLMSSADKTKLNGIAAAAQVNKIETIKVNNSALTISDKAVNITVPTNNNQLTNGAGYQTSAQVQTAIENAIGGMTGISYEVVASLPSTGKTGIIYLLSNSGTAPNVYDEYIWTGSSFEKIGTTETDLTDYLKTSDITPITNSEIDTIVAS